MGNLVVYDRADKVLSIDDDSVMAISGSPAIAYEIARMLEMSVQYIVAASCKSLASMVNCARYRTAAPEFSQWRCRGWCSDTDLCGL